MEVDTSYVNIADFHFPLQMRMSQVRRLGAHSARQATHLVKTGVMMLTPSRPSEWLEFASPMHKRYFRYMTKLSACLRITCSQIAKFQFHICSLHVAKP